MAIKSVDNKAKLHLFCYVSLWTFLDKKQYLNNFNKQECTNWQQLFKEGVFSPAFLEMLHVEPGTFWVQTCCFTLIYDPFIQSLKPQKEPWIGPGSTWDQPDSGISQADAGSCPLFCWCWIQLQNITVVRVNSCTLHTIVLTTDFFLQCSN